MQFSDALSLFTHLITLDEERMRENVSRFCAEGTPLFEETLALIDAHYTVQEKGGFTSIISGQAEFFSDDHIEKSLEGQQFGPYRLVEKLGQGGMSSVYLGERNDGTITQHVAIKFVFSSIANIAGEHFILREAQFLANLNHPNIAKVFNIDVRDDGVPYIVMEYIQGKPLSEFGQENLTKSARISCLIQLCSALTEAHQNRIVHADIKPSNIVLDDSHRPKLLDFGIASSLNDADSQYLKAASSDFSSPQLRNGQKANVTDDVFSLGKVMAFLFPDTQDKEVAAIIEKATIATPQARFKSAEQFKDALDAYRENKPLRWFNSSRRYLMKKWFQRSPTTAFLTLAFPLVLLTGISILWLQNNKLLFEANKNEQILSFYHELFQANTPMSAKGSALSAADFIKEGVKLVHGSKVVDEMSKASILSTLSNSLLNLGYLKQAQEVISQLPKQTPEGFYIQAKAAYQRGEYEEAKLWGEAYNRATDATNFNGQFLALNIAKKLDDTVPLLDELSRIEREFSGHLTDNQTFYLNKIRWSHWLATDPEFLLTSLSSIDRSTYSSYKKAWLLTLKAQAEAALALKEEGRSTLQTALLHAEAAFNPLNPELAEIYAGLSSVASDVEDEVMLEMLLIRQQTIYSSLQPLFDEQLLTVLEQQFNYHMYTKQYAQSASYISLAVKQCGEKQSARCERIRVKHLAASYFTNKFNEVVTYYQLWFNRPNELTYSAQFYAELLLLASKTGLAQEVSSSDVDRLTQFAVAEENAGLIIHTALRAGLTKWAVEYGEKLRSPKRAAKLALLAAYAEIQHTEKAAEVLNSLNQGNEEQDFLRPLASALNPESLLFPAFDSISVKTLVGENIIFSNRRVTGITAPGKAEMLKMGELYEIKWLPQVLPGDQISLYINHRHHYDAEAFSLWDDVQKTHWHRFAANIENDGSEWIDPLVMSANGIQGFKVMAVSDKGYWALSDGFFGIESGLTENNGLKQLMNQDLLVDAVHRPLAFEVYQVGKANSIEWNSNTLKGDTVAIYVLHDSPHNIGSGNGAHYPTVVKRRWYMVSDRVENNGNYTLDPAQFNGQGNAYKILIISNTGYWAVSEERFTVVNPH